MRCIISDSFDAYTNMATDAYILKHIEEDCFLLYRNENAIIIGHYQNALAEINYEYVKEHHIKVARRLSGGGAVYHDLGNLNFTFTKTGQDSNLSDFEKFTKPIVEVLQQLGANAKFEGKNDLMIDGKKISGNAAHIWKNRILHHGTLLFSSEMKNVSGALKINPVKYKDKAVKSIPKRVTNISEHLKKPMTVDEFAKAVMDYVVSQNPDARPYTFTEEDKRMIKKLRDEKFATREWNFGKSPEYNFQKAIRTKGGLLEMNFFVQKGNIKTAKIYGDFFSEKGIEPIEQALTGVDHEENAMRASLSDYEIGRYLSNITLDDLMEASF